jgi:hypothetical protein
MIRTCPNMATMEGEMLIGGGREGGSRCKFTSSQDIIEMKCLHLLSSLSYEYVLLLPMQYFSPYSLPHQAFLIFPPFPLSSQVFLLQSFYLFIKPSPYSPFLFLTSLIVHPISWKFVIRHAYSLLMGFDRAARTVF